MPADTNRDLLFGLIALQVGLVDQAQLVAAFQAWARDKARPLADHLAEHTALGADGRAAIEAMVAVHIERHGNDAEMSLASIPASRSIRDSLARLDDHEIEATLARFGSKPEKSQSDAESERTATYSVGPVTGDGQRFHVLRPHAKGGLGAVFVALDSELNREVALKQILDKHADDPGIRSRFLLEAEVTGGLEHPGIVPVYGLGTYADGRPYYATRFVRGDSLKSVIDQFHADKSLKTDPGRRSLELRKLLRRVTDVCNAIEYAHSRGVLHRDIKPSNVIIGKYGETLVVDWGLAKALGRVHPGSQSGERTLVPSSVTGSAETLTGAALGTPSYMSPEQAAGDLERLGPQSDVYSLGATLYCLLTGRPPAEGEDVGAVLASVQTGEFSKPRKLDPSIDKALEAVCLKAMALEPEDRYATPRALADDIERWLADEPVAAYPERRLERLGRWHRRHRTLTYAAAAIGAAIGIALVAWVATVVIEGARRAEEAARTDAMTNFDMAQKAVEDYLTTVNENTLLKEEDSLEIRKLRQDLLKSALEYYERFVAQRRDHPQLRQQLAKAYYSVGEITQEIGSKQQAIEAFRSAAAIWEATATAEPQRHELKGRLADCYLAIGKLQIAADNLTDAMGSLSQARTILEPLMAANAREASYAASLADCYLEIADIQNTLGQSKQSMITLEQAKSIQEGLIRQNPEKLVYQKNLAAIINGLGLASFEQHDNKAALESFETVQRLCLEILKRYTVGPKPVWLLNLLALSHYNIGNIYRFNGDFEKALPSFEQALSYQSALADSHPSVTAFREKLGISYREIAAVAHQAHQDDRAFQSARRSVEVFEGLVQAQPEQASYHSGLGLSWNHLGHFYDGDRKNTEAIGPFTRAIHEQDLAVNKAKDFDLYKNYLCNHLENLGEQYVDLGRVAEGMPHCERALKIRRELSAAHPDNREKAFDVAIALVTLGRIQRHDGKSAAARQSFGEANKILQHWLDAVPGDQELSGRVAEVLGLEANTLADQGDLKGARQLLEQAVGRLRSAPDRATSAEVDVRQREWRTEALWDFARVLRGLNLPDDARKADAEREALWKDKPPGALLDLVLRQTAQAALIGYGKTPVSAEANAVRELDLQAATANLRLAIDRGLKDLSSLRSHPDSALLLGRDDVKSLIKDLEAPH
jgi:serine/threonine-protein kinase